MESNTYKNITNKMYKALPDINWLSGLSQSTTASHNGQSIGYILDCLDVTWCVVLQVVFAEQVILGKCYCYLGKSIGSLK